MLLPPQASPSAPTLQPSTNCHLLHVNTLICHYGNECVCLRLTTASEEPKCQQIHLHGDRSGVELWGADIAAASGVTSVLHKRRTAKDLIAFYQRVLHFCWKRCFGHAPIIKPNSCLGGTVGLLLLFTIQIFELSHFPAEGLIMNN